MSEFAKLAEKLETVMSEANTLEEQAKAKREEAKGIQAEFDKKRAELCPAPVVAKKTVKRAPRKAKADANGEKQPSLKEVVLDILKGNPDGLVLKELVDEVEKLVKDGKYATTATNKSAVVSQAVNKLKEDDLIQRDKDSHKWALKQAS